MKTLNTLFAIIILSSFVNAQTATSVQDGNFLSTSTWDCGGLPCIPIPGVHDVIINHNVVLDTNYAVLSGTFDISSGASLIEDGTQRSIGITGGTLTNDGTFTIFGFSTSSTGVLENNSDIVFSAFLNSATTNNNSNGNIECDSVTTTSTFINDGYFYSDSLLNTGLHTNNGIDTCKAYTNTGTLTNNGELRVTNFANTGTVTSNDLIQVSNLWNTGAMHNYNILNATNYTNTGAHTNHQDLVNFSVLNSTNLWNTGSLTNDGTINTFDLATTGTNFLNTFSINISNNFYTEGSCTNENYIYVGQNYYNGDSTLAGSISYFTNNGSLNIDANFWNADTVAGTGSICVKQNSVNDGIMLGTLNFCDSTGGGLDFNSGTISSGIVYCDTNFVCFGAAPVFTGFNNLRTTDEISFYPNPTHNTVTFDIQSNYQLEMYNVIGKRMFGKLITADNNSFSVEDLKTGVYIMQLTSVDSKQVVTQRLVKK